MWLCHCVCSHAVHCVRFMHSFRLRALRLLHGLLHEQYGFALRALLCSLPLVPLHDLQLHTNDTIHALLLLAHKAAGWGEESAVQRPSGLQLRRAACLLVEHESIQCACLLHGCTCAWLVCVDKPIAAVQRGHSKQQRQSTLISTIESRPSVGTPWAAFKFLDACVRVHNVACCCCRCFPEG